MDIWWTRCKSAKWALFALWHMDYQWMINCCYWVLIQPIQYVFYRYNAYPQHIWKRKFFTTRRIFQELSQTWLTRGFVDILGHLMTWKKRVVSEEPWLGPTNYLCISTLMVLLSSLILVPYYKNVFWWLNDIQVGQNQQFYSTTAET